MGQQPPGATAAQHLEDGIHNLSSFPADRAAAWLGRGDQWGEDRPFSVGQIAAVVPPFHQWSPPCLQAKIRSDVLLSAAARCGPFSDSLSPPGGCVPGKRDDPQAWALLLLVGFRGIPLGLAHLEKWAETLIPSTRDRPFIEVTVRDMALPIPVAEERLLTSHGATVVHRQSFLSHAPGQSIDRAWCYEHCCIRPCSSRTRCTSKGVTYVVCWHRLGR